MLLFVSWGNKFVIIEWPPFDAPTSTHGVFTSFSLSRCCCLHFCRNKFGLMLAQGYFKGQALFTYCNFLWLCVICNHQVVTTRCAIKYPWCLHLSVYLSAVSYISVEVIFGSRRGDILGPGSKVRNNYKLQLFMNMQSSSGNYSMRLRVPTVF